MTAVIATLIVSILLAVGVGFAAAFSHRLANSPDLRRQVQARWEAILLKMDDIWVKVVDSTEPHRAKVRARIASATTKRTPGTRQPQPVEQSTQG